MAPNNKPVSNASTERWDDAGTADVREVIAKLWARRRWIFLSIVACATTSTLVAFVTTPIFRAKTVLISADSERMGLSNGLTSALGQFGGLASLAGINVGTNSAATEESLAVLRSREFTESFIRERNLMPEIFAGTRRIWKFSLTQQQPTLGEAFKLFDDKVRTIVQDKKTGLVTVQIDWADPVKAAAWANELVARLNAEMQRRAIAQSEASLDFLYKEWAATSVVDTRAAINRLIETQINRRMLANVNQEYAFRAVDKAMVPDEVDLIWPKKGLLVILGVVLGAMIGSVLAILVGGSDKK